MQAAVDAARPTQGEQADQAADADGAGARAGPNGKWAGTTGTRTGTTVADQEPTTRPADGPEPITEPLPKLQVASAAKAKAPGEASQRAAERGGAPDAARLATGVAQPSLPDAPARADEPGDQAGKAGAVSPDHAGRSDCTARTYRETEPDRENRLPVQIWPPVQAAPPAQKPPAQTVPPARTVPPVQAGRSFTGVFAPVQAPRRPTTRKARGRGPQVAGAAALAVILAAAGTVAVVLFSPTSGAEPHGNRQSGPPHAPSQSTGTASLAATWVAGQVSHAALVACDQAMCDALTAHGFPGRHLQLIRPDSPYPLHAQVVVVTPAVQRRFGSSLGTDWAPAVLASFGAGSGAISVRVVAPQGAASYEAALKADLRLRRTGGAGLLASQQVAASAMARRQLESGQVDARLLVVLTALASLHPIDILDFGTVFRGTSGGIPLRITDLADNDAASGLPRSDYLRFLLRQMDVQAGIYRPQAAGIEHDAAGKLIFQIKVSAPSPLGVLGPPAD